jgi:hypothetical protein
VFVYELKKIFINRMILFVTLAAFVLNVFLIFRMEYGRDSWSDVTVTEYNDCYEKLLALDEEDAVEAVTKLEEKYSGSGSLREQNLYRTIGAEIKYTGDFDAYLEQLQEEYNSRNDFSIFTDADEYEEVSAAKTLEVLERFRGTHVSLYPSRGIRLVFNNTTTDILLLFLTIAVLSFYFMREKEDGIHDFIRTNPDGRGRYLLCKAAVFGVYLIFFVVLLFAGNFLSGWYIYGIGPLERSLQSVSGFIGTGVGGSVGTALIWFLAAKILALCLLSAILLLTMVLCRKSMEVYVVSAVWLGISTYAYYHFSDSSLYSNLKNINIMGFLNTGRMLSSDRNIRIANHPVSYVSLFVLISVLLILVSVVLSVVFFAEQKIPDKLSFRLLSVWKDKISGRKKLHLHRMGYMECDKILRHEKAGVILLLLIVYLVSTFSLVKSLYREESDVYYKAYMDELKGDLDDEKIVKVLQIRHALDSRKRLLAEKLKKEKSGAVEYLIRKEYGVSGDEEEAVARLVEHTRYLKSMGDGAFYYPNGFYELTGETSDGNGDAYHGVVMILFLILLNSGICTYDYQYDMERLLKTTVWGHRKLLFQKMMIGLFLTTVFYGLVYGSWYYRILSAYGITGIDKSVTSMEHISSVYSGMTVLQYLLFINVIRLTACFLMMGLEMYLSEKVKSQVMTIIICMGIFLVPMLLYMMGIELCKWLFFNPLILVNGI